MATTPPILLTLNLRQAEKLLCQTALVQGGNIVEAAGLLGITRHALKRRMIKHGLTVASSTVAAQPTVEPAKPDIDTRKRTRRNRTSPAATRASSSWS